MKKWYKSKTIWVNLLAIAAAVGSFFGLDIGVEEQTVIAAGIFAVVGIVLRAVTKEPVEK